MDSGSLNGCKAVLFDFGGTLDSDGEHWLDRFYELYDRAGLKIPRDEIKRCFYLVDGMCCATPHVNDLGLRALMRCHVHLQFKELGIDDPPKEQDIVEGFCARTECFLRRNSELLRRLKNRYRLGVVSNFYGNVSMLCREAGLAESLDVIVDSVVVGTSKPDPEIFEIALRGLDHPAVETVFVGDSYERDMIPAMKLGMRTIWLKGPNPRLPAHPEPVDACISSLVELDSLLL